LQLNAPEKEPVIKEELQAFMFYLDAISLDWLRYLAIVRYCCGKWTEAWRNMVERRDIHFAILTDQFAQFGQLVNVQALVAWVVLFTFATSWLRMGVEVVDSIESTLLQAFIGVSYLGCVGVCILPCLGFTRLCWFDLGSIHCYGLAMFGK
jgi:hypothetical protein